MDEMGKAIVFQKKKKGKKQKDGFFLARINRKRTRRLLVRYRNRKIVSFILDLDIEKCF